MYLDFIIVLKIALADHPQAAFNGFGHGQQRQSWRLVGDGREVDKATGDIHLLCFDEVERGEKDMVADVSPGVIGDDRRDIMLIQGIQHRF